MRKWLLFSFLCCSLPAFAQKNSSLALTHVTVIDCTGAPARPNSTVVMNGGLISAVGPSGTVTIPAGARVVDANGKFLIPGLWDMHGHLTDATADAFPLLIMNGVTGVRDMGGDLAQIDRWRSEINNGTRVGPHIIRAGPFVDGPKEGVTNRLTVRTPEEARQAVRDLRAKGVDFIKVHNALPPDAFFAATGMCSLRASLWNDSGGPRSGFGLARHESARRHQPHPQDSRSGGRWQVLPSGIDQSAGLAGCL
jgi:hypothetical protein